MSSKLEILGTELGLEILVTNASVNGNTSRLALERMPADVQKHGTDFIVIQFGMNDCNHWETDRGLPRVNPKAFAANLEEMITRAFHFGARWAFLNTNHPTLRDRENMPHSNVTYQASNARYNEIIRQVAVSTPSAALIDVEAGFHRAIDKGANLSELLLEDGIHPSEKGHSRYLDIVEPPFMAALEKVVAGLDDDSR